jgi:hypothetical protein
MPDLGSIPELKGSFTTSGDGTTKAFNIPHGLGVIPKFVNVIASSSDAIGSYIITKDITNITVTYLGFAPITGSSNLTWLWIAIA